MNSLRNFIMRKMERKNSEQLACYFFIFCIELNILEQKEGKNERQNDKIQFYLLNLSG